MLNVLHISPDKPHLKFFLVPLTLLPMNTTSDADANTFTLMFATYTHMPSDDGRVKGIFISDLVRRARHNKKKGNSLMRLPFTRIPINTLF
jgi:hypothetical protein